MRFRKSRSVPQKIAFGDRSVASSGNMSNIGFRRTFSSDVSVSMNSTASKPRRGLGRVFGVLRSRRQIRIEDNMLPPTEKTCHTKVDFNAPELLEKEKVSPKPLKAKEVSPKPLEAIKDAPKPIYVCRESIPKTLDFKADTQKPQKSKKVSWIPSKLKPKKEPETTLAEEQKAERLLKLLSFKAIHNNDEFDTLLEVAMDPAVVKELENRTIKSHDGSASTGPTLEALSRYVFCCKSPPISPVIHLSFQDRR